MWGFSCSEVRNSFIDPATRHNVPLLLLESLQKMIIVSTTAHDFQISCVLSWFSLFQKSVVALMKRKRRGGVWIIQEPKNSFLGGRHNMRG